MNRDYVKKSSTSWVRVNAMSFSKLIDTLLDGPSTVSDLVVVTGLHRLTVLDYVRAMRKERALYVSAWEKDVVGRFCIAVYSLGRGTDKPKPKPKTGAVKMIAYRMRKQTAQLSVQLTRPLQCQTTT